MFANNTVETGTGTGNEIFLIAPVTFTNEAGQQETTLPFLASFADGDLVSYFIKDAAGIIQVAGIGTYNATNNSIIRHDTWNYNGTVDKNPTANIPLSAGVHTVRCDVVGSTINNTPDTEVYGGGAVGSICSVPHNITVQNRADAYTASRMFSTICRFYSPVTISKLVTFVTTADGTSIHFRRGIYALASDGGNGGELLYDSGDMSADLATTGVKTHTLVTPLRLPAGTYRFVCVMDSTLARVRSPSYYTVAGQSSAYYDNGNSRFTYMDGVAGALPASFTRSNDSLFSSSPVGYL